VRIGQWDLDPAKFNATGIGIPPRAEQDAIVEFLDRELGQIDSLVEKQKKLLELSKERLRSAISVETNPPASGISEKWREAKVSELGTLTNGYPFDSNTFSHEGGLPLVRIRDLKASEFDTYIPKASCPPSHVVQDGDLLIGMDGDFNAVLWSRGFAALNQRVARLRFKSPDVATYVAFAVQDKLDRINELTYSTTVKHLGSGQIKNIKIAVPPYEELSQKAKKLIQLVQSMGEMVSVSENLVVTLIERRQALISAAVTGQLELQGQTNG
jgi:restriction endonuclease S subunit